MYTRGAARTTTGMTKYDDARYSEHLQLRVTPAMAATIERLAERHGRTPIYSAKAEVVRAALESGLRVVGKRYGIRVGKRGQLLDLLGLAPARGSVFTPRKSPPGDGKEPWLARATNQFTRHIADPDGMGRRRGG